LQNSDSYVCDICEINCSGKALSDKIAACQKLIESYVRRSPIFLLHACTNFLWNYSYGGKITARGFVSKLHDSVPQPERQRSIETGALVTDTIKRSVTVAQLLMDAGNVGRYAARCVTCHAVTDTGQRPIQDSGQYWRQRRLQNADCHCLPSGRCQLYSAEIHQLFAPRIHTSEMGSRGFHYGGPSSSMNRTMHAGAAEPRGPGVS